MVEACSERTQPVHWKMFQKHHDGRVMFQLILGQLVAIHYSVLAARL